MLLIQYPARRTRPRKSIPSMVVNTQTYLCPRCDLPIPPDSIFGQTDEKTHPATKTVHVKCGHCNVVFKGLFAINGDRLEPITPPIHVTNRREIDGVNKRIAKLRGDL